MEENSFEKIKKCLCNVNNTRSPRNPLELQTYYELNFIVLKSYTALKIIVLTDLGEQNKLFRRTQNIINSHYLNAIK